MAEFVKIKTQHLEQLIDVFQMVVDYKAKSLSPHNWQQFQTEYLPRTVDALRDNEFKIADVHNNILQWMLDQIIHSRRVVDGIPKKDWIPLIDIESVQETLSMLRAASRGQTSYNTYANKNTTFTDLFQ